MRVLVFAAIELGGGGGADNHRVLLVGRISGPADPTGSSAEIYDTVTRTFSPTMSLAVGRSNHTATLLPNGTVLVTGAERGGRSAELYHRITGSWTPIADMSVDRAAHAATLLPTGDAGGGRKRRQHLG